MTTRVGAGIVLLMMSLAVRAELHAFKLPDGRSIKAEIIDYNGKLGLVELKLENGKKTKIKPSVFVQADQDYISSWARTAGVSSPSLFKIECAAEQVKKWDEDIEGEIEYDDGTIEKETVAEVEYKQYVYKIEVENNNTVALENVRLEYRIFYEQLRAAGNGGVKRTQGIVDKKTVAGSLDIARLEPKKKAVLTTKTLDLFEKEYLGDFNYSGGDPIKEKGEIKGIWMKVYSKSSGEKALRDVFEPEKIRGAYSWDEKPAAGRK